MSSKTVPESKKKVKQAPGNLSRRQRKKKQNQKPLPNPYRFKPVGTTVSKTYGNITDQLRKSQMSAVAAYLTMPRDVAPVRLNLSLTSDKTALATPYHSITYAPTAVASVPSNRGIGCVVVYRDLLRNMALFQPLAASGTYLGRFTGNSLTGGFNTVYPVLATAAGDEVNTFDFAYFDFSAGFALHDDRLFCGSHVNRAGVWLNAFDTLNFTLPASVFLSFTVYALNGNEWIPVYANPAFGGPLFTFTPIVNGIGGYNGHNYYSVSVAVSGPDNCTVTLTTGAAADAWGWRPVSRASAKLDSINDARVSAVSLLLTNVAPVLTVNGIIRLAQFNVRDTTRVFNDNLVQLHESLGQTEDAFLGQVQKGVYGFLKPSTLADLNMQSPTEIDVGAGIAYSVDFPLVSRSPCLIATFQTTVDPIALTYTSAVFNVTCVTGVEFSTSDTWYTRGSATASEEECQKALSLVGSMPQFYENPLHWTDITKFITQAVGTFRAIAPPLAKILSAVVPSSIPALAALGL